MADEVKTETTTTPLTEAGVLKIVQDAFSGFKSELATTVKSAADSAAQKATETTSAGFTTWLEDLAKDDTVDTTIIPDANASQIADPAVAARIAEQERVNNDLRKQITDEHTARVSAETSAKKADRERQITNAVAKTADPELAALFVDKAVSVGTDGKLYIVIGDKTLTLEAGVAEIVKSRPVLQPALNITGTGARIGNIGNVDTGAGMELDSIGPTSSDADKAKYAAEITRQLGRM